MVNWSCNCYQDQVYTQNVTSAFVMDLLLSIEKLIEFL